MSINPINQQVAIDPIAESLKQVQMGGEAPAVLTRKPDESDADYKTRLQEEYYNDPVKTQEAVFT